VNQNLQILTNTLQNILPHASIKATDLLNAGGIKLWLIDPTGMDCALTEQQTDAAWEAPPYWSFCWGSGLALAQQILEKPSLVAGKTILDFGAGSGIVGIAAVMAGAKRVILCDIDPIAKIACKENLILNGVEAEFLDDFFALPEPVDLLLAADVLYDPENLPLVTKFYDGAKRVLVADSRVKNFSCEGYEEIASCYSVTEPDLGENEDVKTVRFYQAYATDYS